MPTTQAEPAAHGPVLDDPAHHVSFLRQFLRSPGTVGAIAPSSPRLAERMVEAVDFSRAGVVLEYGPGTGAFTGAILRHLRPGASFAAIELNPRYAEILSKRFPTARIVNDSVANVEAVCRGMGLSDSGSVDAILSGLPWASFSDELQDEILTPMLRVLKPGGVFVTFGYHIGTFLPAGKRFYAKARRLFAKVDRSELVWLNLPPAFVMRCVTRS